MSSSSKPSSRRETLPSTLPPLPPYPLKPNGKSIDGDSSSKPSILSQAPDKPAAVDILSPSPEETALAKSSHLSPQELRRRRRSHRKRLVRIYMDYYWALVEELRVLHREYYWRFGVSPYKEDDDRDPGAREMRSVNGEGTGETNSYNYNSCSMIGSNINGGGGEGRLGLAFREGGGIESKLGGSGRCTYVGCKLKAMALTAFCHLHILSDPQQKLYKACNCVIKSAQAGPIICGKPILRSAVPSLCNIHFQRAQKHINRALKKAGLNSTSSSKFTPKFRVIVAEYVRQIQAKRRAATRQQSISRIAIKEGSVS